MRQTDATPATTDATPRQNDATIGDAAKALGVSVRTVQRRIERGQMSVTERDGKRFVSLPFVALAGATVTRQSATVDATPRQSDATNRDSDGERIAELKSEVSFLRGLVEQRDRDAAELRATLREALKIKAPQLTQGSTPGPPQAASTATANNVPSVTPDDVKSATKRAETTATGETDWNEAYGQIADELEGRLNR